MSTSIPISGLSNLASIKSEDFVALVSSSSLTTYRSTVQSFGNWMHDSGSASSSFASVSSSYANKSDLSTISVSSSFASSSLFANVSTSSSFASRSLVSVSSSFASSSLFANVSISSSFASRSLVSVSSSWASSSISSSHAEIASQADTASYWYSPALPKAWAHISWSAAGRAFPKLMENYNISSITYLSTIPAVGILPIVIPSQPLFSNTPVITGSISSTSQWNQFGVVFSAPLSSSRYILIGDGYQPMGSDERVGVMINDFPPSGSAKTINGFTMSISVDVGLTSWFIPDGTPNGSNQLTFINFVIF